MESYAFFIFPSSLRAKTTASTNAAASAIGPAYITPSIPINIGKIMINGSRKITCLVRDMMIPRPAFPIEVKNPEDIGWIPFAKDLLREEPFTIARDSLNYKLYLMIWKEQKGNRVTEIEEYICE